MNNVDYAISVNNVSKSFKLPHEKANSVKSLFVSAFRGNKSYERQHVLKNISFKVKRGEFLGIVGRNGGGKSTLLKLLAEIYVPDSGTITVNGNLTPFIELGVGFNPDLTGRENVYLNGALLGFDRKAMDRLYRKIVEFAELERFMDQKLRNYSSGMQVRLAFSVAIQAHTEILLIDEVLAVGDANFQKKCFDTFENFKKEGRTVIFISHSMDSVKKYCDRAILISNGKIELEGDPEVVASEYDMLNNDKQKMNKNRIIPKTPREAHIVENILKHFDSTDTLVELGSAEGNHIKLIKSMGINAYGVSNSHVKDSNLSKKTVANIAELKKIKDIKGLLILDNRKDLTRKLLDDAWCELSGDGLMQNVYRIYVHLPFDKYQTYRLSNNLSPNKNLAEPLDIIQLINKLHEHSFRQISAGMYGTDWGAEYVEAVFDRFDNAKEDKLWESLRG